MPFTHRRLGGGITIVAVVVALACVASAISAIPDTATVAEPAQRLEQLTAGAASDVVSIYDIGDVDEFVVEATKAAASSVGASAAPGRTGSLGMVSIRRGTKVVHAPPTGWMVPTAYTALPTSAARGIWGGPIASLLGAGTVIMNEKAAASTGAVAGDMVTMMSASGKPIAFRIAAIAPYSAIGGSGLAMSTAAVQRLGATADTRMVVWNISSRETLDRALRTVGLDGRTDTRIARSWDSLDPDDTISTVRVHAAMGEAWYQFLADGKIAMHPTWIKKNLPPKRVLLNDNIPIVARCNVKIMPALKAALAEVDAAGLGGGIDVADANTTGGCWNARFSRVSGQIGFLSRHAYGMAIDTNTVTSCQGCVPKMDCRIVRIFRSHGFAWGGNFRRPDGMHFEWVGEPRDQIRYPSTYCPNSVTSSRATLSESPPAGLAVLTAGESTSGH